MTRPSIKMMKNRKFRSKREDLPVDCVGEDRSQSRRFVMNVELFRDLRAATASHLRAKHWIAHKLLDRAPERF